MGLLVLPMEQRILAGVAKPRFLPQLNLSLFSFPPLFGVFPSNYGLYKKKRQITVTCFNYLPSNGGLNYTGRALEANLKIKQEASLDANCCFCQLK